MVLQNKKLFFVGVETLNDYSQIPSYGASRLGHITEKQLKDNQVSLDFSFISNFFSTA